MRRQFLGDFGGYATGHLCVKGFAKIAQYFRRSDDDKLLETIGVGVTIKRFGKLVDEPFLCNVMPVDFFHSASGNARTRGGSSRTIRALLTRCRIVLLKNPLDDKMDALCVASVAQEERLLTIADEDETVVGNMCSKFRCHFANSKCPP